MSFALYQIVILIIAAFMLYQGIANYFKRQSGQTILKLAVRIIVWGGMTIIVLFPDITNTLATIIGISGNINAVILTGFILIFLIIFKLLSAIEHLEQQISILTRNDTLQSFSQKDTDDTK